MRYRADRPEDLFTATEALAEEDAAKDSDNGDEGIGRGRVNNKAPEVMSLTAEAAVV